MKIGEGYPCYVVAEIGINHNGSVEIAKELNLGLDSIVFWDDNPVERGIVKNLIPEVEVIETPVEVFSWPSLTLAKIWMPEVSLFSTI